MPVEILRTPATRLVTLTLGANSILSYRKTNERQ
jgi:hypothetical protein